MLRLRASTIVKQAQQARCESHGFIVPQKAALLPSLRRVLGVRQLWAPVSSFSTQISPPPQSNDGQGSSDGGTKGGSQWHEPLSVRVVSSTSDQLWRLAGWVLPVALIGGMGWWAMSKLGEDPAVMREVNAMPGLTVVMPQSEGASKVTLDDVKGIDEVKGELREIVQYLEDPQKFTRMGATLPKGVLLVGEPGTGKTLTARAIAGEAGVPFFSTSGSAFDEVFIGVGSKRIRQLFETARKHAPCIVFIDELDGVGRRRGVGPGHNEEGKTLNTLLTEMDGFEPSAGIVVIGATNFASSLDPALVRPGRFNKKITVPLPDLRGRRDIIQHYLHRTIHSSDIDVNTVAKTTIGFSGADLANLVNVAATKAAVRGHTSLDRSLLEEALDDIRIGIKHNRLPNPADLKVTAYHEGGHALVAMLTEGATPVHKVTVVSRGHALGVTVQLPEGDRTNMTHQQILGEIATAMGGRAAEEVVFGVKNVTTGAVSDLQKATHYARQMIGRYGMGERVGLVYHDLNATSASRAYGDSEQALMDSEVKEILEKAYSQAKQLLHDNRHTLDRVAEALLQRETLSSQDLKLILQGKPPASPPV